MRTIPADALASRLRHTRRGAALVETALVMIYLLAFLFMGFEIGTVGYYQLALDGTSSYQARYTALGVPGPTTNQMIQAALPNTANASIGNVTTQNPVQTDTAGVDYNFNDPQARTGGFTFTVPVQNVSQSLSNSKFLHIGNFSLQANSVAIEAAYQEYCPHFCLVPGGITNATVQNDAINYFSAGDNTTPYYIGYHYMQTCLSDPDVDLSDPAANPQWDSCPLGSVYWRAIGTAAHLDSSNDGYLLSGEQLSNSYSGLQTAPPAPNQAGPFFEVWCHRNYYAAIDIQALERWPQMPMGLDVWRWRWFLFARYQGMPNPGAIIYNQNGDGTGVTGYHLGPVSYGEPSNNANPNDQTATAGWDATGIYGSASGALTYNTTLAPWWGCGVQL